MGTMQEETARWSGVFIDRDGTLVYEGPTVTLIEGVLSALKIIARMHVPIIVLSNQRTERMKWDEVARYNSELVRTFSEEVGVEIHGVYSCTHAPEENCHCMMPKVEMLKKAAAEFGFDIRDSLFIGDDEMSLGAGRAAGCKDVIKVEKDKPFALWHMVTKLNSGKIANLRGGTRT
jgi:D-glycero-D-manno-heptose 1,7-bisphosphate phosphatase